jgi:hypothetical protein
MVFFVYGDGNMSNVNLMKRRAFTYDGLQLRLKRLIFATVEAEKRICIAYGNTYDYLFFEGFCQKSLKKFKEEHISFHVYDWKVTFPLAKYFQLAVSRDYKIARYREWKKLQQEKPKSTNEQFLELIR